MTIETYADARAAVAGGDDPARAAAALVERMAEAERLWCLDGDAPTGSGLGFLLREDGYHRARRPAARS